MSKILDKLAGFRYEVLEPEHLGKSALSECKQLLTKLDEEANQSAVVAEPNGDVEDCIKAAKRVILAFRGVTVVGVVLYREFASGGETYGSIDSLYVSKSARGKGVANNLLKVTKEAGLGFGVQGIMLAYDAKNKAAAKLYAKANYKPERVFAYLKLQGK